MLTACSERVEVVVAHEVADGDHLVKVLGQVLLAVDAVQAVRHQLLDLPLVLAECFQGIHLKLDLLPSRVQILQVYLWHLAVVA